MIILHKLLLLWLNIYYFSLLARIQTQEVK